MKQSRNPFGSRRVIVAFLGILGVVFSDVFGFEISPDGMEFIALLCLSWMGSDSIRKTEKSGCSKWGCLVRSKRFWLFVGGVGFIFTIEASGTTKFDSEQVRIVVLAICALMVSDSIEPILPPPKKPKPQMMEGRSDENQE